MAGTTTSGGAQNKLACDCVVPFAWVGLTAHSAMSGLDQNDVTRGMLGARRDFSDEYTVSNPGDTAGKGRVPLYGQLNITFEATLPQAGRWCLLMPAGELWIRGNTGDRLCLQASIGVNAEANEDGTALGAVDFFGFPAPEGPLDPWTLYRRWPSRRSYRLSATMRPISSSRKPSRRACVTNPRSANASGPYTQ